MYLALEEACAKAEQCILKNGDRVMSRDHGSSAWISGVLVSVDPLMVKAEGWPMAMQFDEVWHEDEFGAKPIYIRLKPYQNTFLKGNDASLLLKIHKETGANLQAFGRLLTITGTRSNQAAAITMLMETLGTCTAMPLLDWQRKFIIGTKAPKGWSMRVLEMEFDVLMSFEENCLYIFGPEANRAVAKDFVEYRLNMLYAEVISVGSKQDKAAVIGKLGSTIKDIQRKSECESMSFLSDGFCLQVVGTKGQVKKALRLVHAKRLAKMRRQILGVFLSREDQLSWDVRHDKNDWHAFQKHQQKRHYHSRKQKKSASRHRQAKQHAILKERRRVNRNWATKTSFSLVHAY